jgi:hypothetical protein
MTPSLWVKATPRLESLGSLHFEGWVINQDFLKENETKSALREGYADVSFGLIDLRIGKQVIVWGRADQINPTDTISPRDYTLLFTEDNDQRSGVVGLKASTFIKEISIQGYWIPYFKPNMIPVKPPPFPMALREEEPDNAYSQWAIKLEQTGAAVDGSLSYFDGYDLSPDIGINLATPSFADLVLTHHRIHVAGADAATTFGRFGLRGEAAYTFTEDSDGSNPFIKNPFFFLVAGGDRTYLEYLNINLQYIFRRVIHYQDAEQIFDPLTRTIAVQEALFNNQLDKISQGVAGRIGYKWFNETLEAEMAGIYMFTRHDYMIRPKVIYAFTDHLKGIAGADIFRGDPLSTFGYLRDNSTLYTEIRWGF